MIVLRRHQNLILPCAVPASDKIFDEIVSDFAKGICMVRQLVR